MNLQITSLKNQNIKTIVDVVTQELHQKGFCALELSSYSREKMYEIGCALGEPMIKYSARGEGGIDQYLGSVQVAGDNSAVSSMPTKGSGPLGMHTARAYSKIRPKLFMLGIEDPGWFSEADPQGQTQVLHWPRFFDEINTDGTLTAHELSLLTSKNVKYKPGYVLEEAANEPLVGWGNEGCEFVRFFESMSPLIEAVSQEDEIYASVLKKFVSLLGSTRSAMNVPMRPGILIFLNNNLVGHGRNAFEAYRAHNDKYVRNPRRLASMHVN